MIGRPLSVQRPEASCIHMRKYASASAIKLVFQKLIVLKKTVDKEAKD